MTTTITMPTWTWADTLVNWVRGIFHSPPLPCQIPNCGDFAQVFLTLGPGNEVTACRPHAEAIMEERERLQKRVGMAVPRGKR